jgi:hypothetical protein
MSFYTNLNNRIPFEYIINEAISRDIRQVSITIVPRRHWSVRRTSGQDINIRAGVVTRKGTNDTCHESHRLGLFVPECMKPPASINLYFQKKFRGQHSRTAASVRGHRAIDIIVTKSNIIEP